MLRLTSTAFNKETLEVLTYNMRELTLVCSLRWMGKAVVSSLWEIV